ncbi:hypothetical protein ACF1AB_36155 [Streptomyces sp. NPDC014846]|uniref:hypothetical protein n=1 Tax=Streptomyces sp. NPDC014846 TaxID=3364922 RepID=UPI0036FC504E
MIAMKKTLTIATAACAVVLGGAGVAAADGGAQGAAVNSPGVVFDLASAKALAHRVVNGDRTGTLPEMEHLARKL